MCWKIDEKASPANIVKMVKDFIAKGREGKANVEDQSIDEKNCSPEDILKRVAPSNGQDMRSGVVTV